VQVFFLFYAKNNYGNIRIYFLTRLNLPARNIFYAKNIREAFGPLAYTPQSYAYGSFCKLPFILARFGWNLNLLDRFSKNTQIPVFMNIRPKGSSCSMRIDMTKLEVAFRNFVNVSKNHLQFKEIICLLLYAVLTLGTFW